MSVAALLLALAALMAPGSARPRIRTLLPYRAHRPKTVPLIPAVVGGCLALTALAAVLPVTVVAAFTVMAATLLTRRRSAVRRSRSAAGRRRRRGRVAHDAAGSAKGRR